MELPYDTDPEGAKRLLELQPYSGFGVMTTGAESAHGVKSNVGVTLKYCKAEDDEELVYNFAKWLDENFALYKDADPRNALMDIDTLMEGLDTTFVPAHEGLIKYLKEKGLWTAAHDRRQAQNVENLNLYIDAYQKALAQADAQGIKVDPTNQEWLDLWYGIRDGLPKLRLYTDINE